MVVVCGMPPLPQIALGSGEVFKPLETFLNLASVMWLIVTNQSIFGRIHGFLIC